MTEDEVTAAQRCWTAETLTALYDPFAYPKTEKKIFCGLRQASGNRGSNCGEKILKLDAP